MKDLQKIEESSVLQRVPKVNPAALIGIVKQAIGPKIASVVARSIPVVGTIVALKGAYDKLQGIWNSGRSIGTGDIVGAGLDVASTFGSFITTIPATAYNMARDLYSQAFAGPKGEMVTLEQDLITDPQGTKQRLNSLVVTVTDTIKKEIDIAMKGSQGQVTQTTKPKVAENNSDILKLKELAGLK